jgi:HIRAN domain
MQEGVQPTPLPGNESLEVVGESFYQDNLRHLTGYPPPEKYVEKEIHAVLVAQENNPYDPNAIAVWIKDPQAGYLQVGHLSREDARRYRPGLLAQQQERGRPIALAGVIVGGGKGIDRAGMLGVFLRHDPVYFGFEPRRVPPPPASRMRTGLSDASATDAADDSYDLAWVSGLPDDDTHAIPMLRKLLGTETGILSRHFMYQRLEDMMYRARDTFASALDEYDEACRQHDAEMDGIRHACLVKWGKVPLLETYRQMAIRQQKARNYSQARWWAERGIALYGNDCARSEAVEDLRSRAAQYQAKLADEPAPDHRNH